MFDRVLMNNIIWVNKNTSNKPWRYWLIALNNMMRGEIGNKNKYNNSHAQVIMSRLFTQITLESTIWNGLRGIHSEYEGFNVLMLPPNEQNSNHAMLWQDSDRSVVLSRRCYHTPRHAMLWQHSDRSVALSRRCYHTPRHAMLWQHSDRSVVLSRRCYHTPRHAMLWQHSDRSVVLSRRCYHTHHRPQTVWMGIWP
jgi:hypothetical protein